MEKTLTESVQELVRELSSMLVDAQKTEAGNKAAATRLRQSALAVSKSLKALRVQATQVRLARAEERKASVHD